MERKASDFFESLNGKTVALCGIGGSNLPLIKMFAKYGAKVLACDKRERTALGEMPIKPKNMVQNFILVKII